MQITCKSIKLTNTLLKTKAAVGANDMNGEHVADEIEPAAFLTLIEEGELQ